SEILRESERRKTVNDSKIHDLGLAPMIGGDHQRRYAKDLRSGQRMNVVTAPVSFHQQRITRKMRQQPKFDLRVIGSQQNVSGLGNERRTNPASQFSADGNILQVGIRR